MKKLQTGITLLIASVLVACGGNQLRPEAKKQINTTEVQIIITQPEIYAEIESTLQTGATTAQGASWNAFFNAGESERVAFRKKRAEKAMKPVLKAMKGYKVKSLARRVYDSGLKKVTWMKPTAVKVVNKNITDEDKYAITKKSKADAVIFVEVDYRLSANMKKVVVSSKSSMYYQEARRADVQPVAVYRGQHAYEWTLPDADSVYEHDKLGQKWSQKRAAVLKDKIKEGLESDVKHIVKEMQQS